jgi:hypothetical protein
MYIIKNNLKIIIILHYIILINKNKKNYLVIEVILIVFLAQELKLLINILNGWIILEWFKNYY